jgi:transcriptional regulator with XRE-family HTH domain
MSEANNPPAPPEANESFDAVLAKNLVVARSVGGVTQHGLSAKSGISRATIAQLESGYSDPRLSTISLLAKALDIPLIFLLIGALETELLAKLPKLLAAEPPLEIPEADLRRMQRFLETGMLKDRLRAARLGAAVAQRVAKASSSVFITTAIFSGILPGDGTVVGHALDRVLEKQVP